MYFAQCISEFTNEYGLIMTLFLAGLVGGFTHCSSMCAPFVLAQGAGYTGAETRLQHLSAMALLPYHAGRMSTYVVLAILFHSVFNLALLFGEMRIMLSALVLFLAALIFAVNIVPVLTQVFPWAARLTLPVSYKILARLMAPLQKNIGTANRYAMGVLLGFIPCAMVVAAIMASSTAPNAFQAGLAMMAFSFGTIPALFLVSALGQALQMKFPKTKDWIKGTAGIASAIWLFILAGMIMV